MAKIKINPQVQQVFDTYPSNFRKKLLALRDIIIECAEELNVVQEVEETLKWGEPSYLVDRGSTIRIGWKQKKPEHYSIFFKCTSKLVPTFRKLYKDKFDIIGDRELAFKVNDDIHRDDLKQCIKAALQYHQVKHLPNLGISE
jgi:hypothetical protein